MSCTCTSACFFLGSRAGSSFFSHVAFVGSHYFRRNIYECVGRFVELNADEFYIALCISFFAYIRYRTVFSLALFDAWVGSSSFGYFTCAARFVSSAGAAALCIGGKCAENECANE